MNKLTVELCSETGICSIVRNDGTKVDLMPNEVQSLRAALKSPDGARQVLAEVDAGFAESLASDELSELAARLK